jgi:hypothetical protein
MIQVRWHCDYCWHEGAIMVPENLTPFEIVACIRVAHAEVSKQCVFTLTHLQVEELSA